MISRALFLVVALVAVISSQGFVVSPSSNSVAAPVSTTSLFGCRVNAKKEKIKRNRENMRKFSGGGTGTGRNKISRRKLLKKLQSNRARQEEAEFIAKCFKTGPAPNEEVDE